MVRVSLRQVEPQATLLAARCWQILAKERSKWALAIDMDFFRKVRNPCYAECATPLNGHEGDEHDLLGWSTP